MDKKISVIVPVYNVEEFLPKCLDSLVSQTLQEIEIIVVNDGSPDNSQGIIDQYVAKYPDKVKSYTKENGGLSDARNFGLQYATGEYLAFVDSDDSVDLDMFEKMYQTAAEGDYDIVTCPITYVKGRVVERRYHKDTSCFGMCITDSPYILRYTNSYAWNKIYRRSFWNQHAFRFPVNQWFEDSAVIYNVLLSANKIGCVNIPFYNYVQKREGAITSTADHRIFDIFKSVDSILDFYTHSPGYAEHPELQKEIEFICIRHIMARVILLARSDDKKLICQFLDKAFSYLNEKLPNWKACSYVTPSKRSSRKTKITKFIRRHKWVAKRYYCCPRGIRRVFSRGFKWLHKKKKGKSVSPAIQEQKTLMARQRKNAALQENGALILSRVQTILSNLGLSVFVDCSTLLGLVRDGNFLESDTYLHMGVVLRDEIDVDRVKQKLERKGVSIWRIYYLGDTVIQLSCQFFGIRIDLHFYRIDGSNMKLFYFYRQDGTRYPYREGDALEITCPAFSQMQPFLLQEYEIHVPNNAKELLAGKFGQDWQQAEGELSPDTPGLRLLSGESHFIQYRYYGTRTGDEKVYEEINEDELSILRRLQLIELSILKEFDRICKQHNLRYFLSEGALLGAVRHHGFIPWDDDLDVAMPREDYNKFLSVWNESKQNDDIALFNERVFSQYYLTFTKLIFMKPTGFYNDRDNFPEEYRGPYIDIFPLDKGIEVESPERVREIRKYRDILLLKMHYMKPRGKRKKLYALLSHFYSFQALQTKIQNMYQHYNHRSDAHYIVNFASSYPPKKETFPKEIFEQEPKYVSFEDMLVPIPADADAVLRQIYGDYMQLPPFNKRKSRHLMKFDESLLDEEEPSPSEYDIPEETEEDAEESL